MADLVLYQYPGNARVPSFSPPCLKISLALRRLGIPHRVEDLTSPLAVRRRSPTGRVPAIAVDGRTIADSVFILDQLQVLHPEGTLWPADPVERAVDRVWDCFGTDTLYWQGFYLRWLVTENRQRVLDAAFGAGFSVRKAIATVVGRRILLFRAAGQGIGGRSREDVEQSFALSLSTIETGLRGGPFLQGRASPGRGDLAIAAHVAQLRVDPDGDAASWLARKHPSLATHLAATFEACGLQAP